MSWLFPFYNRLVHALDWFLTCFQWGASGHVSEYKIKQMFFIFNYLELLSEHKRLTSRNLSVTYQREPHTLPPSCTKPQQLTI